MRFSTLFSLVAAVGFVTVNACNCGEDLGGITGSLKGNICDADTGAPLVNVPVELEGGPKKKNTITGADGSFVFSNVAVGKYTVTADDNGTPRTIPIELKETDKPGLLHPDTACRDQPPPTEGGELKGQICNRHTGDFVSDADIIINLPDGSQVTGTTDDTGSFDLTGIPEGPQVVEIRGAGYQRAFAVVIDKAAPFVLDLADDCNSVDLTEGGVIGSYCDPNEANPDDADPLHNGRLVGADVKIVSDDSGEEFHDLTDTTGSFEYNGLLPGRYKVDATKTYTDGTATYRTPTVTVDVVATQLAQVTDTATCADSGDSVGRIEGQMCEQSADGFFTGAIDLLNADDTVRDSTTSDAEGRFHFNLVPPGTYSVHAHGGAVDRTFSPVVVDAFRTTFLDVLDCPPPDDICSSFQNEPDVTSDGRILLVVDRSGSMQENDDTGFQQKWVSMKNALTSVTQQLQSHVEFGLMLYPGPDVQTDVCDGGNQVLGLSLNNANAIANQLSASTPNGGTPTAVTMAAAKTIVQSTLSGDGANKRPLAVLLATDGGPNCNTSLNPQTCTCTNPDDIADDGVCTNVNCLDDSNVLTQIGAIHQLGVKTFVIGVLGVAAFDNVLSSMADAGGSAQPGARHYFPANNQAQLESALDAITHQVLACHVEDTRAGAPDLRTGVTSVTVSVGATTLNRDPLRHNGWDVTGPHTIDLFGSACDTASAPNAANVTVDTCVAP